MKNDAAVPKPSDHAPFPDPAKVLTRPVGEILRTRFPPQSPTYKFSVAGSIDMP